MSLMKDAVLVFKLDGERQELHLRKVTFAAWEELRSQLGYSSGSLLTAFAEGDVLAQAAVIWLTKKQTERTLRWNDVRRDLEAKDHELEVVGAIIDGEVEFGDEEEVKPPVPPTTTAKKTTP